jgi:hypothetical protein
MIRNRYSKERTSSGMKIPQKELQKYNKEQQQNSQTTNI